MMRCVKKGMALGQEKILGELRQKVVADESVVFEWLKKKQADGVERGWKDGGPSA